MAVFKFPYQRAFPAVIFSFLKEKINIFYNHFRILIFETLDWQSDVSRRKMMETYTIPYI